MTTIDVYFFEYDINRHHKIYNDIVIFPFEFGIETQMCEVFKNEKDGTYYTKTHSRSVTVHSVTLNCLHDKYCITEWSRILFY